MIKPSYFSHHRQKLSLSFGCASMCAFVRKRGERMKERAGLVGEGVSKNSEMLYFIYFYFALA